MSPKNQIRRLGECPLKTDLGNFKMFVYEDVEGKEHVALVKGEIEKEEDLPCRVHSSCLAGEAFHATTCSCHEELRSSMKLCQRKGRGVIVYLNQHGGGEGISSFAKQMRKAKLGVDKRNYQAAAGILNDLEIGSIRLMTGNSQKVRQLRKYGVKVKGIISF